MSAEVDIPVSFNEVSLSQSSKKTGNSFVIFLAGFATIGGFLFGYDIGCVFHVTLAGWGDWSDNVRSRFRSVQGDWWGEGYGHFQTRVRHAFACELLPEFVSTN